MIFEFVEIRCIFEVLQILTKGKSKYSLMFKETKVSHITLQSVLKKLADKKFIIKHDIGHQKVDYEITQKGKKIFGCLSELKDILK